MKTLFLKFIVVLGLLLGLLCNASDAEYAPLHFPSFSYTSIQPLSKPSAMFLIF